MAVDAMNCDDTVAIGDQQNAPEIIDGSCQPYSNGTSSLSSLLSSLKTSRPVEGISICGASTTSSAIVTISRFAFEGLELELFVLEIYLRAAPQL